jgi:hypothetical protein
MTVPSGATLDISSATLTPPATMPASSAANLTSIPAANVTGVLPVGVTGGSGLSALNATNLTSGSIAADRFVAGSVLQVVALTPYQLVDGISTTSETPIQCLSGTDGELVITTKKANSKLLIRFHGANAHINPDNGNAGTVNFIHYCIGSWSSSGTSVQAGAIHQGWYTVQNTDDNSWRDLPHFIEVLHSPSQAAGTTIRYREYFCQHSGNTSVGYWNHLNGVNSDTNYTNIYYNGFVMEIAQ